MAPSNTKAAGGGKSSLEAWNHTEVILLEILHEMQALNRNLVEMREASKLDRSSRVTGAPVDSLVPSMPPMPVPLKAQKTAPVQPPMSNTGRRR